MPTSEMLVALDAPLAAISSPGDVERIVQVDPGAFYRQHREETLAAIARVVDSGWYILGEEVRAFEEEFARMVGVDFGIGVANGTDAVGLALRALGVGAGDYVATVSHTAVATVAAIQLLGARPVFVDIGPEGYLMGPEKLDAALAAAPPVKAVVVVHLYGQVADVPAIAAVARLHGARVVEDCAQAHGARLAGRSAGSMGEVGCFSFYPTKNLGALGDGGMVVTDDALVADRLRRLREYGWRQRYISETPGTNSRLDELQAALLRLRLPTLAAANQRRREIASSYRKGLEHSALGLPDVAASEAHVYHQYVVRHPARDRLQKRLAAAGIQTNIHYPVPVHLQPAYTGACELPSEGLPHTERASREVLSLPIYAELQDAAVARVIEALDAALEGAPL